MQDKEIALGMLRSAFGILRKDLEALQGDAFDKKLGEKARTVADIVFEINLVNDHIGRTLRREPLFDWPDGGWITASEDKRAKDVVLATFTESSERFLQTIEAMTPEELVAKFTTEHGETDGYERCRFVSLHLWYHSGQLNFIQTLLGDDGWHW